MAEFFRDYDYETIYRRHKRVVSEPACAHGQGQVFAHAKRFGLGERIIMPLAEDGRHCDGLFGATIYRIDGVKLTDANVFQGERVTFHPIEQTEPVASRPDTPERLPFPALRTKIVVPSL
jgi:hypothetical protein